MFFQLGPQLRVGLLNRGGLAYYHDVQAGEVCRVMAKTFPDETL